MVRFLFSARRIDLWRKMKKDWRKLPESLTEAAKAGKSASFETKNNRNTKPPSRGKGGSTGTSSSLGK